MSDISYKIIEDYGSFGDSKWQLHLTKIKWGNNEPKFDLRAWNEDMSRMGKGVTLTDADLVDLSDLIEVALGGKEVQEEQEEQWE